MLNLTSETKVNYFSGATAKSHVQADDAQEFVTSGSVFFCINQFFAILYCLVT